MAKQKCNNCHRDAVVVECGTFYSCAHCWLKNNAHKKGKKNNEKSFRVS